jgi:pyruvate,water dikinase
VVSLKPVIADVWEIHMRVNIPPMGAVFGMEELLTAALGPDIVPRARQMLQGFDNKSIETGRALWALSRWIREDNALHKALLAARVRDGGVVVEETARTGEFQRRWQEFLDTYGWRSDRFGEIGHPSWREEPSTALTQLKAYLAVDDDGDPFASHARQAAERDQIASEIEEQLPEPMRPMFRGILPIAQQYIPIAEDHNFTIDQKFTVVVRHAVLQLGRKLTAAGVLSDPEEVFFLMLDEIRNIADGGATDGLSALARQRQRERVKQATMRAPVMIGAPIPEDAPPDPIITKFFGVGQVPSDKEGVVTGHPCSSGVVTGVAKVVRTLDEAGKLEPGDVLVCRMTMPAWTPLFGVAAAVVADSGGPLSHCAIVAREYGIPCVAGTVNGTDVLKDGMRVRVDGAAGMVTVLGDAPRG